jgi:hypothetical protein
LGKRKEVVVNKGTFGLRATGFMARVYDQDVFVERPTRPQPRAYGYRPYQRSSLPGPGYKAQVYGLLASPTLNRDIRSQRVDEYHEAMQRGDWRDLLSDPITVTSDGQVLNGQHRIAAASHVDWSKAGNDPAFLVVWNVEPEEALYADGSRRTKRDETMIATRLLEAVR